MFIFLGGLLCFESARPSDQEMCHVRSGSVGLKQMRALTFIARNGNTFQRKKWGLGMLQAHFSFVGCLAGEPAKLPWVSLGSPR